MLNAEAESGGRSRSNRGRTFPIEVLTVSEVERLIAASRGSGPLAVRNRAMVAMLWRSGLRISELLSLRPSDVHAGAVNVRKGKGSKQRVVTYDQIAAGYLSAWLAVRERLGVTGRQPLFCSVSNGETRQAGARIDPSYMRHLLPRLARRAGIDKRTHCHGLRHTMATELAAERLRLPAIAAQLGHSSTATTDNYLRKITSADLQDDMAAIGRTV
jgi:integrase/recombinase XerD